MDLSGNTDIITAGSGKPEAQAGRTAEKQNHHPAFPSKLFVETTTRCNLRCRMCVKQSRENAIPEGDLSAETFRALEPAFPHLEALVLNGIGEPLLHPRLDLFIARAKDHLPRTGWVGFQSNGRLLDEARALSLISAGLDRICLSVDAISPDVFRQVRQGGEISNIDRALSALKAARDRLNRPEFRIGAEFVLMRDNIAELPETVRWAGKRGVDFIIVTHLLPYGESMNGQVLYPPNTDLSVEFFRSRQKQATARGINIGKYFEVRWNYRKSSEEQKLIRFVEEMVAEAESRDIPFHLRNLLKQENPILEEISEIFRQAEAAARSEGVRLKLPALLPTNNRRCAFVEDNSMFVSWEGKIHPCYFLWHRYACFINGASKPVEAKVFGDLSEQSISEIWTAPAFADFREKVRLYDYPFCGNCNLGPCDLVTAEPFEQDCYTIDVPCGDCPWSLGLLHCMQ